MLQPREEDVKKYLEWIVALVLGVIEIVYLHTLDAILSWLVVSVVFYLIIILVGVATRHIHREIRKVRERLKI